jgi:hypothetical protein
LFHTCVIHADTGGCQGRKHAQNNQLAPSTKQGKDADQNGCSVRPALPQAHFARWQAAKVLKGKSTAQ